MARYNIIQITLVVLAFICFIQAAHAHFDMVADFTDRIQETIKKENLNCDNYLKFCEKSNEQFQTSNDIKDRGVNDVAIELCKAIVRVYVCPDEVYND